MALDLKSSDSFRAIEAGRRDHSLVWRSPARTDGRRETQEQAKELQRQLTRLRQQQDQLLDLRLSSEVDDDLFTRKGVELRDRVAIAKEQLDGLDVTRGENAAHAIEVFELSQAVCEKWLTANYAAKREILDIVFSNFRLDGVTLCDEMRKPFALLAEGLLVSNSGVYWTKFERSLRRIGARSKAYTTSIMLVSVSKFALETQQRSSTLIELPEA